MGLTGFNRRRREIARAAAIAAKETSTELEKPPQAKKLNQMNKIELLAYATSIGLEFDTKATKKDILAAILEHEAKLDERGGNDNDGNDSGNNDGEASD